MRSTTICRTWLCAAITILLLSSGAIVSACSSATPVDESDTTAAEEAVSGTQPDPAATEPHVDPTASSSPEQLSVCDDLVPQLSAGLDVEATMFSVQGVPWVDLVDGATYNACEITFNGSGEELALGPTSYMAPAHSLRAVFKATGREEDLNYAADGPGASIFGYRGDGDVCTSSVSFEAPEGAVCADEDPITCGLPPSEQVYTIKVVCALLAETIEDE